MAEVLSVAAYALHKLGYSSTMKLQKVVYYSQAYHLVKHDEPLFGSRIEAWVNGPVVPDLFEAHRGKFVISDGFFGDPSKGLSLAERGSVEHVVSRIGEMTGAELSELTHSEDPWKDARGEYGPEERCSNVITAESMRNYYSLFPASNPVFNG